MSDRLKKLEAMVAAMQSSETDSGTYLRQNFLQDDLPLQRLLQALALPRWFDASMISGLLASTLKDQWEIDKEGKLPPIPEIIEKLLLNNICSRLPQLAASDYTEPQYRMEPRYREQLRRHWQKAENREALLSFSAYFRDVFRTRVTKYFEVDKFEESNLLREVLYHSLVANEVGGLEWLRNIFPQTLASDGGGLEWLREELETAEFRQNQGVLLALINLARDQQPLCLNPQLPLWIDYYQGRLAWMSGDWKTAEEFFEKALTPNVSTHLDEFIPKVPAWMSRDKNNIRQIFEQVVNITVGPKSDLVGHVSAGRGDLMRSQGEWAQAMEYYQAALDNLVGPVVEGHVSIGGRESSFLNDFFEKRRGSYQELLQQANVPKQNALAAAKILVRQGNLSLEMGESTNILASWKERYKEKETAEAETETKEETDGRSRLGKFFSEYRANSRQKADEARLRANTFYLGQVIRQRLRQTAKNPFIEAKEILGSFQNEAEKTFVWRELNRDTQYGLGQALLAGGELKEAMKYFSDLEETAENLSLYDRAEIALAKGDYEIFEGNLGQGEGYYQKAAENLQETWDVLLRAKALHRLGLSQVLQEAWESGVDHLLESRRLLGDSYNLRQEESVQESLRELIRDEEVPDHIKQAILEDHKSWSRHIFVFSSSLRTLKRLMKRWYPAQFGGAVPVAILTFLVFRFLGSWVTEIVGLDKLFLNPAVQIMVGLLSYIYSLQWLEDSIKFRTWVGGLLPLDTVWGSQPGMVIVDDKALTYIDSDGDAHCIRWEEVTEVRHGRSDKWTPGEAGLFSSGSPGGRTLVFSDSGTISFDAGIHSYIELDNHVQTRLREELRSEAETYETTYRSMTGTWPYALLGIAFICGCPAIYVFTLQSDTTLVTILKILAVLGIVFSLAMLAWILRRESKEARRMREHLYPPGEIKLPPVHETENLYSQAYGYY